MSRERADVAIIMGSQSDWATMRHAAETLDALGIPHDSRIISAHRTPDRLYEFAKGARDAGFKVIIAGAGGAAHLPGMTAALTPLAGVRRSRRIEGAVRPGFALSIVQMPAGIPVGTLAIGKSGAINAALLAAAVLALSDAALAGRLDAWRASRPTRSQSGRCKRRTPNERPLPAGATIGIIGGGQLGRMLAMAAARLGYRTVILEPQADCPAAQLANRQIIAAYDDPAALDELARTSARRHLRVRERAGRRPQPGWPNQFRSTAAGARWRWRRTGWPKSASSTRPGYPQPSFCLWTTIAISRRRCERSAATAC